MSKPQKITSFPIKIPIKPNEIASLKLVNGNNLINLKILGSDVSTIQKINCMPFQTLIKMIFNAYNLVFF